MSHLSAALFARRTRDTRSRAAVRKHAVGARARARRKSLSSIIVLPRKSTTSSRGLIRPTHPVRTYAPTQPPFGAALIFSSIILLTKRRPQVDVFPHRREHGRVYFGRFAVRFERRALLECHPSFGPDWGERGPGSTLHRLSPFAEETHNDHALRRDPETAHTWVRSDLSRDAESAGQSSARQRGPARKDKESKNT